MIYPQEFEHKIGFSEIRQLLEKRCLSSLGQEEVQALQLLTDSAQIAKRLAWIAEFMCIVQEAEDFPCQYFIDVRPALRRIRIEGTHLTEEEVFDLKRSLETVEAIVRFLRRDGDTGNNMPIPIYQHLKALTEEVIDVRQLTQRLNKLMDATGQIKDSASPELGRIRTELARNAQALSGKVNSILRAAQSAGYVDKEVGVTLRDGRLLIPVAPEHKRKLRGVVYDESSSGKTLFIEPAEVIEIGNRIRELENDERREIVRILTTFTEHVRTETPDLSRNYCFLARIDYVRAAARFSIEIKAEAPAEISPNPILVWKQATHPLLQRSLREKTVVPLDITLTPEQPILLISGPNAGGKSVCLKTVGLLQYMLQCGLPIPLSPDSKVGVFQSMFLDMGDEQSIENELSTYAAHLANMKIMLRHADAHSLILIDEFGGGTEPQIGGAIAESILDRLHYINSVWGVITTHYQNLKQYADSHEGIANGAMLYDRARMEPHFRLAIGQPGSSFAIEIARKTGLPDEIIRKASDIVGQDYVNADKYVQDIVRDKMYWEEKRKQIRRQEKAMELSIENYRTKLSEVKANKKAILEEARQQAEQLLTSSNAQVERTIRIIKESKADKQTTQIARKKLDNFRKSVTPAEPKKRVPTPNKLQTLPLQVGSFVRIKEQTTVGQVEQLTSKTATVIFGTIKTKVKIEQLEVTTRPPSSTRAKANSTTLIAAQNMDRLYERKLNFNPEIDVRGMRGDEAIAKVVDYLDDALQVNIPRVRILHGTGNGILRNLIREYLSSLSYIKSYQDEHVQLGGSGITVIDI